MCLKFAVKLLIFLYIAFVLISSVGASFGGALGGALNLLAYALPVFVGFAASRRLRREREERAGVAESEPSLFSLDGGGAIDTLVLAMPVIALAFLISYLTSLVLTLGGAEATAVPDAPLYEMLIAHALVPSVLEEMLFRYLPMKLIAPYSKRWCVVISSVTFALLHLNFFQIPYALFAGAVFIMLDLAALSVWPSFILHLLNNTISVLWIKFAEAPTYALWHIIALVILALLSVPFIIRRRARCKDALGRVLDAGEPLTDYYPILVFGLFTVLLSFYNLLS